MRKNAQIKSKAELATRLMAGEVFYSRCGGKCWYSENGTYGSPFRFTARVESDSDSTDLMGEWEYPQLLDVEADWHDSIPAQGVICYVSDKSPEARKHIAIVTSKTGQSFKDAANITWLYATPINFRNYTQDYGADGASFG